MPNRFRPLAGLSCINPFRIGKRLEDVSWEEFPSPRGVELHKPSCDRQQGVVIFDKFPSPRGVELHKPAASQVYQDRPATYKFPSPRGVELHKPADCETHDVRTLWAFPSPRGVELHKPRVVGADLQLRQGVSVPSRG